MNTTIYWSSSTGTYKSTLKTVLSEYADYGVVLDIDTEDLDDGARGFQDATDNLVNFDDIMTVPVFLD